MDDILTPVCPVISIVSSTVARVTLDLARIATLAVSALSAILPATPYILAEEAARKITSFAATSSTSFWDALIWTPVWPVTSMVLSWVVIVTLRLAIISISLLVAVSCTPVLPTTSTLDVDEDSFIVLAAVIFRSLVTASTRTPVPPEMFSSSCFDMISTPFTADRRKVSFESRAIDFVASATNRILDNTIASSAPRVTLLLGSDAEIETPF